MRLPRMTMRRWMIVVVLVALILGAITQLVVPIMWDSDGRARDHDWLKTKSSQGEPGPFD
jgi:hypothetical protein